MNITSRQESDKFIVSFKDTHNTIVNSVRRVILDEVPTFAVEDVEIVANESPIYDEIVALRVGLIPLKTDLKNYNMKENCKCGGIGCALCEVTMSLKQDTPGYIYSGIIKSNDPKVVPADDKIPITKITKKKKIELNLKAVLGKGRDHAKWAPAHTFLKETDKGVDLIIEPFGQLEGKEIYNTALDILGQKLDELEAKL